MKDKPFSFETINNFDKHIQLSIPNYQLLRDTILTLSDYFKIQGATIYDLGCSTGKLLEKIEFDGTKIGVDNSINLLPRSKKNIEYHNHDLNDPYAINNSCIVYAIFILQFLKKPARKRLLRNIYDGLVTGGALFITEKLYEPTGQFQDIFHFAFYDYKGKAFSADDILEKEKTLRLILRPQSQEELKEDIAAAGFKKYAQFFKYLNFEGWLCIK